MSVEQSRPNRGLAALFAAYGKVGLVSFGGPSAQIGLLHQVVVEERGWLSDEDFARALSLCMLLPGPEAMQLAVYAGWRTRGVLGGLIAGALFVLPGAAVMAGLLFAYGMFASVPAVGDAFVGVKAAVVAIVFGALLRMARKVLVDCWDVLIAAGAFVALFAYALPFFVVLMAASVASLLARRKVVPEALAGAAVTDEERRGALRAGVIGLALWLVPLGLLWLTVGGRLAEIGLFFASLAVVTFGGAYAVLSLMAQDVVSSFGWVSAGQMADGLGLAESTPGPLILVTIFIGGLAADAAGSTWMAFAGFAVAFWATFVPPFVLIFLAAPYLSWVTGQRYLAGALRGVLAAVVGTIANLAVWFALVVLFGTEGNGGGQAVAAGLPSVLDLDLTAAGLVCASAILVFWFRWPLAVVIALSALAALVVGYTL